MWKCMVGLVMFLLLLPSRNWAEPCQADIDCDKKVGLADLVIMKQEYLRTDCDACPPPAPVAKTGQTTSHAGGDDGELQKGVAIPDPRFTDNNDGTATDNFTGLIWLKDANCAYTIGYDPNENEGGMSWNQALEFVAGINAGIYSACGGALPHTDWRLPNVKELLSVIEFVNYDDSGPMVPAGHPFANLGNNYWSSTTHSYSSDIAYEVDLYEGWHLRLNKDAAIDTVWPVRGPE